MAIGDQAAAAGYPLVPGSGEDGRVRHGAREINRTRDLVAQVKGLIPTSEEGYQLVTGIQKGRIQVTFNNVDAKSGNLPFPVPFSDVPNLQLTVQVGSNFDLIANIQAISATGFTWRLVQNTRGDITGTAFIHWLAVGT